MIKPVSEPMKCSYCQKRFFREQSRAVPFCSTRCQQLDLRNWLTESYGLPVEGHEDQPDSSLDTDESSL